MKRNLVIAFGFLLILAESSGAQVQCNIPCWQQSFPYVFCDPTTDNLYIKCSTNPNADGTPVKAYIPGCVTVIGETSMDTLWQPNTTPPQPEPYLGNDYFDPTFIDDEPLFAEEEGAGTQQMLDSILFEEGQPPVEPPASDPSYFTVTTNPGDAPDSTDYTTLDNPEQNITLYAVTPYDYDPYPPDENPDFISDSITYDSEMNVYDSAYYAWKTTLDVQLYYQYLGGEAQYQADLDAWQKNVNSYVQPWNDAQADSDAQHALDNWLGVCQPPIQPDGSGCCIHIYLDDNPRDFNPPVTDEAETVDDNNDIGVPKCGEASCADVERFIRVNTTQAFLYQTNNPINMHSDPNYKLHASPTTMWYTTPTGLPATYESNGSYEDHSFFQLMEHEMGHWFGLMHPESGPPDGGRHFSCPNCYTENPYIDVNNQVHAGGYWTVMAQGLNFAGDTSLYLTSEDSCQFKKLYCPQDLSVKLSSKPDVMDPTIFPNPTTGASQLQYEVTERALVQIAIYDQLGNPVKLVSSGYEESGKQTIPLGTESLPSGNYVCRIRVGESVTYLNVAIEK